MISEKKFQDKVQEILEDKFGSQNIEKEKTLYTERRPDFTVDIDILKIYVEVENTYKDILMGIAQAKLYSRHYPNAVGIVVYPKGLFDMDYEREVKMMTDDIAVFSV